MKKNQSISLRVYFPETEKEQRKLTRTVAEIHGDMVEHFLHELDHSAVQKLSLIDAVIEQAKHRGSDSQAG